MKYLFLAYRDEEQWSELPSSKRIVLEDACVANDKMLRQRGTLLTAEHLQSNSVVNVQVQNGKVAVLDDPPIQGKGRLTGLYFIDARDLNHAIHVASEMPQAREGTIEVRPVM